MKSRHDRNRARIERALTQCAANVRSSATGWECELTNGATLALQARLEGEWLVLETGPHAWPSTSCWELLCLNAELQGPVKLALRETGRCLIAEIHVDEPDERVATLAARLARAVAALASALARLRGKPLEQLVDGASSEPRPLEQLCAETGWPARRRDDGGLVVDLQARRGTYRAAVEDRGAAGVRVSTRVARFASLTRTSRDALALFLLSASAHLRVARAAAVEGSRIEALFERWLPEPPTPAECAHALAALATACETWGRETETLADSSIARAYLGARRPRREKRVTETKSSAGSGRARERRSSWVSP